MPKFRKKPVVIEAFQSTEDLLDSPFGTPGWLLDAFANTPNGKTGSVWWDGKSERLMCGTLEGPHEITEGDWIIRGIKGELYPCKPDIFEATYELVEQ